MTIPAPVPIGTEAVVALSALPQIAELKISITPFREAVKASDVANVKIPATVALVDGKGKLTVTVNADGEFNLLISANGDNAGLGIIAEAGKVWIGMGGVSALLQTRMLARIKTESPGASDAEIQKKFQLHFHELMKERLARGSEGEKRP